MFVNNQVHGESQYYLKEFLKLVFSLSTPLLEVCERFLFEIF